MKEGKNRRGWASPEEVAAVRARLIHNFPEPTDDERTALAEFTARLTGKKIGPNHAVWIRDVLVVHGPGAEAALEQGYREGGWDNLFIRVVDAPVPSTFAGARGARIEPVDAEEWAPQVELEVGQVAVTQDPLADVPAMPPDEVPDFHRPEASPPPDLSDLWACYPGLLYGPNDRPPFDPTSKTRWDDRPSNPDRDALKARHEAAMRRAQR